MRKGLAAGATAAILVLAGCSGSGGATNPTASAPAPSSTKPSSDRKAPVKSVDLSDACSIVTTQQAKALGADQAPRPNQLHGVSGCNYQQGEAGTSGGWSAFVAADKGQTFQGFMADMANVQKVDDIAGYPAAQIGTVPTNCILVLDVSDKGLLDIETLSRTGTPNPCEISKQVAEAALQNLPNA